MESNSQIPGAPGTQPVRQHVRLDFARPDLRFHHPFPGNEPAHHRAVAVALFAIARYVPGRIDDPDPERGDSDWYVRFRHPSGAARSAHSLSMTAISLLSHEEAKITKKF